MIDNDFIKTHTLLECLQEFKGARKHKKLSRLDSVTEEFKALAKKLLYGGHFVVSDNENNEIVKIELCSVEFYYHEEKDDLVDKNDNKDEIIQFELKNQFLHDSLFFCKDIQNTETPQNCAL